LAEHHQPKLPQLCALPHDPHGRAALSRAAEALTMRGRPPLPARPGLRLAARSCPAPRARLPLLVGRKVSARAPAAGLSVHVAEVSLVVGVHDRARVVMVRRVALRVRVADEAGVALAAVRLPPARRCGSGPLPALLRCGQAGKVGTWDLRSNRERIQTEGGPPISAAVLLAASHANVLPDASAYTSLSQRGPQPGRGCSGGGRGGQGPAGPGRRRRRRRRRRACATGCRRRA